MIVCRSSMRLRAVQHCASVPRRSVASLSAPAQSPAPDPHHGRDQSSGSGAAVRQTMKPSPGPRHRHAHLPSSAARPDQAVKAPLHGSEAQQSPDLPMVPELLNMGGELDPRQSWYSAVKEHSAVNPTLAYKILMQWRASSNPQKIAQAAHSLVLSGLAKQGGVLLMQTLLQKMRQQGPAPNAITYNTMLDGLRRARKYTLMTEVLDQMVGENIVPTLVTYTMMVHAWVALKQWDRIEQVLQADHWAPDTRFFESLLRSMSDQPFPFPLVLQAITYTKMHEARFTPAMATAAMGAVMRTATSVETIRERVLLGRKWVLLSPATAEAEVTKMVELRGMKVDQRLRAVLLANGASLPTGAAAATGAADATDHTRPLSVLDKKSADAHVLTTMLRSLFLSNDVPGAMGLFKEMLNGDLAAPTQVTYAVVVEELCKRGMPGGAEAILRSLLTSSLSVHDIERRDRLFCAVVSAFTEKGDLQEAMKLLNEMHSRGILQPDRVWAGLIVKLGEQGFVARASVIVERLRKHEGPKRSIALWNSAIAMLVSSGRHRFVSKAEQLLHDLEERGPRPNSETWSELVQGLVRIRQWERAEYWLQRSSLPGAL